MSLTEFGDSGFLNTLWFLCRYICRSKKPLSASNSMVPINTLNPNFRRPPWLPQECINTYEYNMIGSQTPTHHHSTRGLGGRGNLAIVSYMSPTITVTRGVRPPTIFFWVDLMCFDGF